MLLVLYENEPVSLKELGELLICEQKSPSRLVQGLVEKGLIYKGTSQSPAFIYSQIERIFNFFSLLVPLKYSFRTDIICSSPIFFSKNRANKGEQNG